MRIVYHFGVHCTDDERLIRCLLKNKALLEEQDIDIAVPNIYRRLMRDVALDLKGEAATPQVQSSVLEQIVSGDLPERLVLSWENFLSFPQWVLRGGLYSYAGPRSRAFRQIFPFLPAEFCIALRNPATLIPALYAKQKDKTYDAFMDGNDLYNLRWSDVIHQINAYNPNTPITVWCDEDTPLIWPEVLQAVSGHADGVELLENDELLTQIMTEDGLKRLRGYLTQHPPASPQQRRKILTAFLEKFAIPDQIEMTIDLPGWDAALIEDLSDAYYEDIQLIKNIPNVNFITA